MTLGQMFLVAAVIWVATLLFSFVEDPHAGWILALLLNVGSGLTAMVTGIMLLWRILA